MNALSPSNEDSHRAPTPQCDRYAENERGSCLHNAGGYRQPPCRCRSEEHTSELQSRLHLVCRLLLEKNKNVKQLRELAFSALRNYGGCSMNMTDPIADMLTRIRNAVSARHAHVLIPASNMQLAIARL